MPEVVIIPVKSFRIAKQRLAGVLDEPARARLGQALADHVASAVAEAGLLPLVVTGDPVVAHWATTSGLPSIPDPGPDLDSAVTAGVDWALQANSRWIVLHADLPLLTTSDVDELARPVRCGEDVIAPSADGGTPAIASMHSIDFSFGPASFHRHLARLDSPLVLVRSGLLLDIDSPRDLEAARRTARGQWLDGVLR